MNDSLLVLDTKMLIILCFIFKGHSAILLVYEGKHVAVLRKPEVFSHRKEERINRQFGSAHPDHPSVKVSKIEKVDII